MNKRKFIPKRKRHRVRKHPPRSTCCCRKLIRLLKKIEENNTSAMNNTSSSIGPVSGFNIIFQTTTNHGNANALNKSDKNSLTND